MASVCFLSHLPTLSKLLFTIVLLYLFCQDTCGLLVYETGTYWSKLMIYVIPKTQTPPSSHLRANWSVALTCQWAKEVGQKTEKTRRSSNESQGLPETNFWDYTPRNVWTAVGPACGTCVPRNRLASSSSVGHKGVAALWVLDASGRCAAALHLSFILIKLAQRLSTQ